MDNEISKLLEEADRYRNKKSWLEWLGLRDDSNRTLALECYTKAYNKLLISKNFKMAAETAVCVAELNGLLGNDIEYNVYCKYAARNFVNAGDFEKAIPIYHTLIQTSKDNGNISTAARLCKDLAEVYASMGGWDDAVKYYQEAVDLYQISENWITSIQYLNKICDMYFEQNKIFEMANTYTRIIDVCVAKNVNRVNEYLAHLILCEFYVFAKADEKKLEDLFDKIDRFPDFVKTNEYALLSVCINAFINDDEAMFRAAVRDYESVAKLDIKFIRILKSIVDIIDANHTDGQIADELLDFT